MRKAFALFIVLVFVFAIGCSGPAEEVQDIPSSVPEPAKEAQPATKVDIKETPEEKTGEGAAAETPGVTSEYTSGESSETKTYSTPIGSRAEDTEHEAVDEQVPAEQIEIALLSNKTMSETARTVSTGTTLYWKNYDSWPHQLAVETGKGFDTKRHAESTRLLEGNVWQYTFNEKGTFLVRDIFSGGMRMTVTVE